MKGFILFTVFCLTGCSLVQTNKGCGAENAVAEPRLSQFGKNGLGPVIDLIDYEAAEIWVVRATGSHGAVHPLLARALGISNDPPTAPVPDVYRPTSTEKVLTHMLKASPNYSKLALMLDPDNTIEPRAVGNFSIDYSNFSENTVHYLENSHRTFYTYEIGLSFRLLDPDGRLAFERKFVHVDRQICIFRDGGECLEIRSKQPIVPEQKFRETLQTALNKATMGTAYGLQAWADVLRHIKAEVAVYHGSGRKLKIEQSADRLRQQRQADYRYLYVNLPSHRVLLGQLFDDLEKRGENLDDTDKRQLVNYITTSIRSYLDAYLQKRLESSQSFAQAGIFLLPDPNAIWFHDALSLYTSNVINDDAESVLITDEGIEYQEAKAFGLLCQNHKNTSSSDICLSMNVKYVESSTVTSQPTHNVVCARQDASFATLLLDTQEQDASRRRKSEVVSGVGLSQEYIKMVDQDDGSNEDRNFLRESIQRAAADLARKMADTIISVFHESMAATQSAEL